jgi:hypothetical protein
MCKIDRVDNGHDVGGGAYFDSWDAFRTYFGIYPITDVASAAIYETLL